jgi:protein phosphatase 2C
VWQNGLRVMGALSMTRAIGDHFLRAHGVIPDPEVSAVRRGADDEFLILATDGLWNWVGPADAADVARRAAARSEAAGLTREAGAGVAARALTRLALARGSSDNVTVRGAGNGCKRGGGGSKCGLPAACCHLRPPAEPHPPSASSHNPPRS